MLYNDNKILLWILVDWSLELLQEFGLRFSLLYRESCRPELRFIHRAVLEVYELR